LHYRGRFAGRGQISGHTLHYRQMRRVDCVTRLHSGEQATNEKGKRAAGKTGHRGNQQRAGPEWPMPEC
jgi:hypothetical protein